MNRVTCELTIYAFNNDRGRTLYDHDERHSPIEDNAPSLSVSWCIGHHHSSYIYYETLLKGSPDSYRAKHDVAKLTVALQVLPCGG